MTARSIMLAAGGTGGHLFPAYALAEELRRRGRVVDLVTDMRGDRYGTGFPARKVYQVPAATLAGRNPVAAAKTVFQLARGVRAASRILAEVHPGVVVGFGGYPTFPPLFAASLRRIPTLLHEQNAVLGRANRMLAKRVTAIATSFEKTRLLDGPAAGKARFTGNPVRDVVVAQAHTSYAPSAGDDRFRLVVFGGSQGARFFSDVVVETLPLLALPLRRRLSVTMQCRPEDQDRVTAAFQPPASGPLQDNGISAEIGPFFKDLPERIAAAHLVVGRAGASTVAELAVIGRPAILVPLPHALDNDQLANATRLAESGGGWCIEQKDLTPQRLAHEITALADDPGRLAAAAAAAKRQGRPDAVARLADLVEALDRGDAAA